MTRCLGCRLILITSLGAYLLFLGGCGGPRTKNSQFYLLSSLADTESIDPVERGSVSVAIGPLQLADHLNRAEIVTRVGENELELAEFHRWAGSITDHLPKVLAENLSVLLATERIDTYPWSSPTPADYQVTIDITRFDGEVGGDVIMRARWMILGDGGGTLLSMKQSSLRESAEGNDYPALVAAKSRMLVELSRQIASEIRRVSRQN